MNWRAAVEGRPLVEPMHWQASENPDAYEVPDEFRFGTELIVSPVVTPNDKAAMRGRADVTDLLLHAQMLYRTKELALNAVHELGVDAISAIRTMNRGPRYDKDFWVTEIPDAVSGAIQKILLRS